MGRISFALLLVTLFQFQSVQAETYIWTSREGLISAQNCRVGEDPSSKLSGLGSPVEGFSLSALSPYFQYQTRWQAKIQNGREAILHCQNRASSEVYRLFEVYSAESTQSIAEIGLDSINIDKIKKGVIDNARVRFRPEGFLGVPTIDGPLAFVICANGKGLPVLDSTLSKAVFKADDLESARQLQTFASTSTDKTKVINGKIIEFVKVQFPSRSEGANSGWIPKTNLKAQSQCAASDENPVTTVNRLDLVNPLESLNSIKPLLAGATESGAWTFPTLKRPTDSYKTGQRRFGAGRGGGRVHAACDLYRTVNESAVSVSPGEVIRDRYYFYQGTYAIEVKHTGGKIARYGEITGKQAPGIQLHSTLVAGQTVGYVGKVNSNCCSPMLHFEFYSGTASGALSQSGNKYKRRKDLIDPTDFLTQWEKQKFGKSF